MYVHKYDIGDIFIMADGRAPWKRGKNNLVIAKITIKNEPRNYAIGTIYELAPYDLHTRQWSDDSINHLITISDNIDGTKIEENQLEEFSEILLRLYATEEYFRKVTDAISSVEHEVITNKDSVAASNILTHLEKFVQDGEQAMNHVGYGMKLWDRRP
jgi:hypothetical protein